MYGKPLFKFNYAKYSEPGFSIHVVAAATIQVIAIPRQNYEELKL